MIRLGGCDSRLIVRDRCHLLLQSKPDGEAMLGWPEQTDGRRSRACVPSANGTRVQASPILAAHAPCLCRGPKLISMSVLGRALERSGAVAGKGGLPGSGARSPHRAGGRRGGGGSSSSSNSESGGSARAGYKTSIARAANACVGCQIATCARVELPRRQNFW